jgi:predicted XRE-type DNA-binding protein
MNKYIGSSFDSFLAQEGILADAQARAIKRIVVWHIEKYMKANNLTKKALAEQLKTSRAGVDRLLDEGNLSVTLGSLVKVAEVTGKRLQMKFSNP